MKNIKRKWEWVAEKCEELGFYKASKVAREIDKVLVEIYGDKHTEAWEEDYMYINSREATIPLIVGVVQMREYCIACEIHKDNCSECKFVKKVGECLSQDSLYGKFVDVFNIERDKKVWKELKVRK